MDKVYCMLVPVALWLGMAAFALALFLVVFSIRFPFTLTPGGFLRGAQTLLLLAVASYCALRTPPRT